MKKILEFLKKHDKPIVILFIACIISGDVFWNLLSNGDELINFFNTYKMSEGLTIYKDANVIITPLFFYIGKLFLLLLGKNILVFRIYNLIIYTFLYFIIYEIFKTLKVNKKSSLLYTIIIVLLTRNTIAAGANYNILSYVLVELGLLATLKIKNDNLRAIAQGILTFLVFFTSQKLFAGYFLILVIFELKNKNIKILVKELIIALSLLIIYLGYLKLTGNLYYFVDYTILGIREFANKNVNADANMNQNMLYIANTIITTILYIIVPRIIKKIPDMSNENKQKQIKLFQTVFLFSLAGIILIVPILNSYHIIVANILIFVSLLYMINFFIKDILNEKIIYVIIISVSVILAGRGIYRNSMYFKTLNEIPENSPLYGAILESSVKNEMGDVIKYIKNSQKDVMVFSTYSPMYSLVIHDLNNGKYDWLLRGNLGSGGEEKIINEIKSTKNKIALILEDEEMYQFVHDAVDYIENNWKNIGKVGRFKIYETIEK